VVIPQLFVKVADMKGYFIDWYWPEIQIAVEIDGKQHLKQRRHDERRDRTLTDLGYTVSRISTAQLLIMMSEKHKADMTKLMEELGARRPYILT